MCGIIGIAGLTEHSKTFLQASVKALSARGPDDHGIASFPNALLGHTRLAVIDLSDLGHQPMADQEHDNTIVFNGEIYNYKEVRTALEKKGHNFTSHSDTEVILKAYAEYGEDCPKYFDGQFAFGIWDEKNKKLFLARDPFGEKPLYIATAGSSIIFGSEIKALLATGLIATDIDQTSLDNYLALLYVPPWRSIYKGIVQLRPGHTATWHNGTYTNVRYWQLEKKPGSLSLNDTAQQLRTLMTESVRTRMVADVEVGAFLSGGMDSSIVVRLAQLQSESKVKTFSAGFENIINELPYAKEIADLASTDHVEATMHEDLAETFLEAASYFDEPFGDSSNVPTSLIAKLARRKVKVALSGDGGDELFWGYGQYTQYLHLPKLQMLLNALSGRDAFAHYKATILMHFTPDERRMLRVDTSEVEEDPTSTIDYSQASTPLEKINITDFYLGLPGDMLTKVDRASMMHSLEVRSPFLNTKLAQFAYNLPAVYKTDGRKGKIIFKEAFGDLLPDEFFTRKKQGFGAPVSAWLTKPEFRKLIDSWFTADAKMGSHLNMQVVRKYVDRFYAGEKTLQYKVWSLLALEAWFRTRTV
jgi:asparagine synthase (glutamine-hydrolysing)